MVDVDFCHDDFISKSLKCLTNFINKDFSAKPWNRFSQFTMFISPKKNLSVTKKDHRFNRLSDCAMSLLYHLDDISQFLEKNGSILNDIAILDRDFLEMEVLKPIYAAVALIGVHVTRPFHDIILDPKTNYTTLLDIFKQLYNQLDTTKPDILITKSHVLKFSTSDQFEKSLPKECLLDKVIEIAEEYNTSVINIMEIILRKFKDGFSHQKGAIFGFGTQKDDDTKTVLKISNLDPDSMEKLNQAPIHNLGEERAVGMINYELQIRGKSFLETSSRNLILNKSHDLIKNNSDFKLFKKEKEVIAVLRKEWSAKMKELDIKGFTAKEALNLTQENKKLKDLENLKQQEIPGPFTSSKDVLDYMSSCPDSKEKNKRMYLEVRYARESSCSLKRTAIIFKLKNRGKNLNTEDYATNLCHYFDSAKSCSTLTLADLNNVLTGLKGEFNLRYALKNSLN